MALIRIEFINPPRGRRVCIAYIPHQSIIDIREVRGGTSVHFENFDTKTCNISAYFTRESPDGIVKRIRRQIHNDSIFFNKFPLTKEDKAEY